jgi:hypothetical protein
VGVLGADLHLSEDFTTSPLFFRTIGGHDAKFKRSLGGGDNCLVMTGDESAVEMVLSARGMGFLFNETRRLLDHWRGKALLSGCEDGGEGEAALITKVRDAVYGMKR